MADVAELGVRVTLDGAQQAAQGLDNVAAAGTRAEASTKRLIGTSDGLTASQRALVQQGVSLDQVMKALGTSTTQLATAESNVTNIYNTSRPIVLAHMQALEMDAAAHGQAAAAAGVHGLQLGRVNMELGTAIGRFTGMNTAATRFVAMLGGAVGGYGTMIAISLAVVAAAKAYEALTESTRKAKEAQDEATESLRKWYETKANGEAGERSKGVAATLTELAAQQKHLDDLNAKLASPNSNRSESVEAALLADIAKTKALMATEREAVDAGRKDIEQTWESSFMRERDINARALAERLKFSAQDESARKQALQMLKEDQALYEQYLRLPASPANNARVAAIAQQISVLRNGVDPKSRVDVTPVDRGGNAVIEALTKELDVMRKVNEEDNVGIQQAQAKRDAVGKEGLDLALLHNTEQQRLDTLKAFHDLSGIALTDRLAAIQTEKDLNDATAKTTSALQARAAMMKQVAGIGKANEEVAKKDINDSAKKIRDAQDYQDQVEKIFRTGIERIISHGTKSWQDFFGDVLKMFSSLMDAMEREAKKHNTTPGAAYKGLGIASAAIGGGLAGYDIAKQTGSAPLAIGGGALSGFELGNAILPGIGGVVGGVAGAVGGLIGLHKSASEAADALMKIKTAEAQVSATLADWRAQITGTAADQKAAAKADLYYKYLSIRQTIEQVEAGKKMEEQRNKDLAEADALYKQAQDALTKSTNALSASMLNAVQGYKYQAAIFAAAPFGNSPSPIPPPPSSGGSSSGGNSTGGGPLGGSDSGPLTVNLVMSDGTALGSAVIADWKKRKARGDTSLQVLLS